MTTQCETRQGWTEDLLEALEHQNELVTQLDRLASSQRDLIEADRTDALLSLLQRRQALIEGFVAGQARVGELTEDLEARLETVDAERAQVIRSLIGSISERLNAVMDRDSSDQAMLEERRGATKDAMRSLGKQAAARSAYTNRGGAMNRYADQQG